MQSQAAKWGIADLVDVGNDWRYVNGDLRHLQGGIMFSRLWNEYRIVCIGVVVAQLLTLFCCAGLFVALVVVASKGGRSESASTSVSATSVGKMTEAQLQEKAQGKTKDEVIKLVGRPVQTHGDDIWRYIVFDSATLGTANGYIYFKDGVASPPKKSMMNMK
jgi:outer membrane protein assembly factor BamE (lipoprotein component of BamABCDE complex)